MSACETVREMLSAYLDGELTQYENQKVDVHLRGCAHCRQVYADFSRLRAEVKELELPEPSEAEWRSIMAGLSFKAARGLGWLLWAGGALVLGLYGIYEFASDPAIEALERVCVLAIVLGAVLVFITVLAERVAGYRHDKYKDVEK